MKFKSVIDYVIDVFFDIIDWIDSYLDQKLESKRVRSLLQAIFMILVIAIVFCLYQIIQDVINTREYNRIVRAERQYNAAGLHNDHYGGKYYYGERDYEGAILNYASFINKFPSILYTESDAKKPEKMDEAIINVLLSLRRLNRHYEIFDHVSRFKIRFPESKVVPLLNLYNTGLSSLYSERWDLLNLAQSLDQEAIKRLEAEDNEAAVDRSRVAAERRDLARKTFETARSAFEKLSSHSLLNTAPYSEFRGESLYFLAKSFFIEGNYTRAYQEFDKIATVEYRTYPDLQDDVMYYTAYCLKQLNIYDEAFGRYSEFMTRFPNSEYVTDAYFDLGQIYSVRKEYDSARGSYRAGLQRARNKSREVEDQLKNARISYEDGNKAIAEAKAIEAEAKSKEAEDETKSTEGESKEAEDETKSTEDETKEVEDQAKAVENKIKEAETAYKDAILIYRGLLTEYQEDFFLSETLNFISKLPVKPDDWSEDIDRKIMEFESFVEKHGQERGAAFQAAIGRAYYDEGIEDDKLGNDAKSRDAYNEAIASYKLLLDEYSRSDRAPRTKLLIANIYNKLSEYSESIKAYTRILDDYESDYGEEKEVISVEIKGSPKATDLRAFCVYEIGVAHDKMQDYEKALEWYKKIIVKNGFEYNDTADTMDLRRDALAPDALNEAMQVFDELDNNEALKNIATTYIEDLRKDAPLLSAEAQLNFAHIKYAKLKQSGGVVQVAREFKKLGEKFVVNENGDISGYLPDPDLRFNLIRLHGKYYEGLCYEHSDGDAISMDDLNADMNGLLFSTEAYHEVTTLFKTTFQPLINAPNIDVRNRDYYITEATRIFEDLVNRHPIGKYAAYWRYLVGEYYYVKKDFEKAIAEYQKVLKDYPTSDYIKESRDRIEEIREKLGNEEMDSSKIGNNSDSSRNSKTTKQLTAQDIAEIALNSTLFLDMNRGTGSGFFVGPGLIATNYHVVEGNMSGTAKLVGTDKEYAIIGYTAIDVERDLAILKVRAFGVNSLPLGNSEVIKISDDVYAVGNPLRLVNVVSDGKISSIQWVESIKKLGSGKRTRVSSEHSDNTPYRLLMMTAPISPGNSGGPVLNSKSEVIGVSVLSIRDIEGRAQNLNCAIPVNDLKALLNRIGPPKPLSELEIVY